MAKNMLDKTKYANNNIRKYKDNVPHPNNRLIYQKYLSEITKYDVLSVAEEKELFIRIKNNDQSAVDSIIKHNLKFVVSVARAYAPTVYSNTLTLEDLVNEGNIGLILAVKSFDHTKGFKFISFAVNYIRQHMVKAIRTHIKTVRIPENRQMVMHKLSQIEDELEMILERQVDDSEIIKLAKDKGLINKKHDYSFIGGLRNDAKHNKSLTTVISNSSVPFGMEQTLLDFLENPNSDNVIDKLHEKEMDKFLDRIKFKSLPKDVLEIITLYYGLDGEEPKRMREIAQIVGLHEKSLSYKLNRHLKRLKKAHIGEYKILTK